VSPWSLLIPTARPEKGHLTLIGRCRDVPPVVVPRAVDIPATQRAGGCAVRARELTLRAIGASLFSVLPGRATSCWEMVPARMTPGDTGRMRPRSPALIRLAAESGSPGPSGER
jgi:hypothetical protein